MKTETLKPLVKNTVIRDNKPAAGCCGGAPSANQEACCKLDEDKKAEGAGGCGCNTGKPAASGGGCC